MKRLMPVLLALALAACHESSAPPDAAGTYLASSVNGRALPTVIESYTTADGKACTASLVEGVLNLYGAHLFDFDLSYRTVCDGGVIAPGIDRTTGTYAQAASQVVFQPQMQGVTRMGTADLTGRQLRLRGLRNSGTVLDLVFDKQASIPLSSPVAPQ